MFSGPHPSVPVTSRLSLAALPWCLGVQLNPCTRASAEPAITPMTRGPFAPTVAPPYASAHVVSRSPSAFVIERPAAAGAAGAFLCHAARIARRHGGRGAVRERGGGGVVRERAGRGGDSQPRAEPEH